MKVAKVTRQLIENGFSTCTLKSILKELDGELVGNTLKYFCILRATRAFSVYIDLRLYHIPQDHLVFLRPGRDLQFIDPEHQDIYALTFTSDFHERAAIDIHLLHSGLFFDKEPHIVPSIGSEADFNKLIVDRMALFTSKEKAFYNTVVHNCIEALILDGLLHIKTDKGARKSFSEISTIDHFKVLLERHYKEDRRVEFYSELLEISPRKLSGICERILGKNAKKIITERVLKETVKLLNNSDMNIAEITYDLGFSDEGYFSNFVKKHTGKSPKTIRETNSKSTSSKLIL
ncbi:helix-turn-helix domain-containing protein [Sinomicrobium soli]|uniref:helix-turn-helix domain-containing protein n=1 Tax=Sinomicrobium sp. N-1-3-6 TaxID=2219864 RepID=UPI001374A340|nr:AraC family transcriptional regulator [Sinomicrobium sp. N-1-3-6]